MRGRRRLSRRDRRRLSRVGKALGELPGDCVRNESDAGRVGADERAAKNARGPAREIVPLECLEVADADLAVRGNGRQGDVSPFTFAAQSAPELFLPPRRVALVPPPATIGSRSSLVRLALGALGFACDRSRTAGPPG